MRWSMRYSAMVFVMALPVMGQEPAVPKGKQPIDSLKLPPGTVILVTPNPREHNPNVDAVILTPEEYQKLLAASEQLKKLSASDRSEAPSVCRLELHRDADAEFARVRAHFHFRTESARSNVLLGLENCRPVKASLEGGKLPSLVTAPIGGFQFVADSVGEYRLLVEAVIPLTNSPQARRGFKLGLPGAAITILERLDLPTDVNRPLLNGQPIKTIIGPNSVLALGPTKSLEVDWEIAPAVKPGETFFTVDSRIEARLDERFFTTTARHHVKVLRGSISEFQLTAPANAKISVVDAKSVTVEAPGEMRRTLWTLRRPPSADDLVFEVQMQLPATRRPLVVQGFPIARAAQIRGTLELIAPDYYRFVTTPRGELIRRDQAANQPGQRLDLFEFLSLPANGVLADLDPQPVKGELEAKSNHTLRLMESAWRLSSKFELRPNQRDADRIELEVPADLTDFRLIPADVFEVMGVAKTTAAGSRLIPLRPTTVTRAPLTLILEGDYKIALKVSANQLMLPRVVGVMDRGGTVTLELPPGTEARAELREWDHEHLSNWERPLTAIGQGKLAADTDRAPARLDITWRAAGADQPIRSFSDIEVLNGQAQIRQIFRIPSAPSQFHLRGPTLLAGRLNVTEGGTLSESGKDHWVVRPTVVSGKECTITIEFAIPIDILRSFAVPLLWPDQTTSCEYEVRVWAAPGPTGPRLPMVENGPWNAIAIPVVSDRTHLPALAIRTTGFDVPLVLRFSAIGSETPNAIIERTWIRASVDEVGAVAMRTRFLVRPLRNAPLAIRLPGPPILLRPSVRLDGRTVDVEIQNQQLMVPMTISGRSEHVLDINCTLPARSGWNVKLESPRPVGPINFGSVRWQVHGPEGDVGFETSAVLSPLVRWGWQRGLWSPTPGLSDAAMVRWFAGDLPNITAEPFDTTLLAMSERIETVWMVFIPRAVVSLLASLIALGIGGWLLSIRWNPIRLAMILVGLCGLLIIGWNWPQPAGELITLAQPGLVILLPAALVAGWIRRRAERRSVFAPLQLADVPVSQRDATSMERTAV